jgi:hypothetical protein
MGCFIEFIPLRRIGLQGREDPLHASHIFDLGVAWECF